MDLNVYVEKLYRAWVKYQGIRILVDYDDTIKPYNTATCSFCKDVVDTLIEAQRFGAILILWTCRSGDRLTKAIQYCKSIGLVFNEINPENPFLPGYSLKAYGNVLLDDKAGLEQALNTLKIALSKYKMFIYETDKK